MSTTLLSKNGTWYELEVTPCKTYVVLRDKFGVELTYYFDAEGFEAMREFLGFTAAQIESVKNILD